MREVHIVGGHHPDWPFEYYERMIAAIHAARPEVQIKAFTAAEIDYFWRRWKIEPREALTPAQGGRAAVDAGRRRRDLLRRAWPSCSSYTGKADADRWCEIHGIAHGLGIQHQRHDALRPRRDARPSGWTTCSACASSRTRSGGFLTFIPLAYQIGTTKLVPRQTPPADSLRTIAAARLLLDNFPHIEAYWVMLGRGDRVDRAALRRRRRQRHPRGRAHPAHGAAPRRRPAWRASSSSG